jgi:hypothetical protein
VTPPRRHYPKWAACTGCKSQDTERLYRIEKGAVQTWKCNSCKLRFMVLPILEVRGADGNSQFILPGLLQSVEKL